MEGSEYSGSAGPKMGQQFCTYCGNKLTPGTRFCTNCGAPVESAAEPEPVVQGQEGSSAGIPGGDAFQSGEPSPFSPYLQNGAEKPGQGAGDQLSTGAYADDEEPLNTGAYVDNGEPLNTGAYVDNGEPLNTGAYADNGQQYNTGAYSNGSQSYSTGSHSPGGSKTDFNDKGTAKLSLHMAGIVCYLFSFVGWLVAYFLGDRTKHYLRFHLNQALVLMLANMLLRWILPTEMEIYGEIFVFVLWCFGVYHAFRNEEKGVPLLGRITLIR